MDYVRLGASGLQVSRLCLGCMSYGQATTGYSHPWASSEHDGRTFIKRALDLGINFFDTANNYQDGESEAVLGRAIRDFAHRDEVVLATKVLRPCSARTQWTRPFTKGDPVRSRQELAAPLHRLYRPLPDPSIRQANAARGDAQRAQ